MSLIPGLSSDYVILINLAATVIIIALAVRESRKESRAETLLMYLSQNYTFVEKENPAFTLPEDPLREFSGTPITSKASGKREPTEVEKAILKSIQQKVEAQKPTERPP